jgi:hypothetical protein
MENDLGKKIYLCLFLFRNALFLIFWIKKFCR